MKSWLDSLIIALVAALAPVGPLMAAVGALVAIDFCTGVWRAYKVKSPVTSAGFRRTVTKSVVYLVAVLAAFLVEHFLMADFIPVSKIVAGFIGVVELKSILENSNAILGYDVFKKLIKKLGSINDNWTPKQ